eukprot:1288963-Rhodomonas_salina.2
MSGTDVGVLLPGVNRRVHQRQACLEAPAPGLLLLSGLRFAVPPFILISVPLTMICVPFSAGRSAIDSGNTDTRDGNRGAASGPAHALHRLPSSLVRGPGGKLPVPVPARMPRVLHLLHRLRHLPGAPLHAAARPGGLSDRRFCGMCGAHVGWRCQGSSASDRPTE